MEKPWYQENGGDEDKIFEEAVNRVRSAIKQSLSFKQATDLLDIKDEALRKSILDDVLKVLIADMHFSGKKTLDEMARALKLPLKVLEQAKKEMLKDVEAAAIESYKSSTNQKGNA